MVVEDGKVRRMMAHNLQDPISLMVLYFKGLLGAKENLGLTSLDALHSCSFAGIIQTHHNQSHFPIKKQNKTDE